MFHSPKSAQNFADVSRFRCTDCDKYICEARFIEQHMKSCSKTPAPLKCQYCQSPMSRADVLNRHQKKCTKKPTRAEMVQIFSCDYCKTRFQKYIELKAHMEKCEVPRGGDVHFSDDVPDHSDSESEEQTRIPPMQTDFNIEPTRCDSAFNRAYIAYKVDFDDNHATQYQQLLNAAINYNKVTLMKLRQKHGGVKYSFKVEMVFEKASNPTKSIQLHQCIFTQSNRRSFVAPISTNNCLKTRKISRRESKSLQLGALGGVYETWSRSQHVSGIMIPSVLVPIMHYRNL